MQGLLGKRGVDWMRLTGSYDEVMMLKRIYARHDIRSSIHSLGFDGLFSIHVVMDE